MLHGYSLLSFDVAAVIRRLASLPEQFVRLDRKARPQIRSVAPAFPQLVGLIPHDSWLVLEYVRN
ncbi:hypothetical protein D3C84_974480 [compost metagenome]